jgi:hypothetical protein
VENLRADKGMLESLGWDEMVCADTMINFIESRRNNAKNRRVNNALVVKAMKVVGEEEFPFDSDATYIDSGKQSAEYSYQGRRQMSGLLGCIAESGIINTVDYRRGNASPQVGILNQLKKACAQARRAGKRIRKTSKELKAGFGCDYTPSHDFEKNRGYFLLGVLAHNATQILKLFYFGSDAVNWIIKTVRYRFINVCGKIIRSGRRFYCKIINVSHEVFERFRRCQAVMIGC